MRESLYPELRSGEVEYTENRTIIHFGSPAGAQFTKEQEN